MQRADPKSIGWCDVTANPIKAWCRHGCEYCYMFRPGGIAWRFKKHWPKEPRLDEKELDAIRRRKPSRIWGGSSTDMWGDWVASGMIQAVLDVCAAHPRHTYLFLTKNPKRYAEFNFPPNSWLGVTIERDGSSTGGDERDYVLADAAYQTGIPNTFWSCEPLLGPAPWPFCWPEWLIVGADSRKGAAVPPKKWVDEVVRNMTKRDVPVFIKPNLARHYPDAPWANRREIPT